MDLHDKRNGEKHHLSSGALEEVGQVASEKGSTNKRTYMKYHEGEDYSEGEKEDGRGVPHRGNRRPSRTSRSTDDDAVERGEADQLAKSKKKAKAVNELSSHALSPSGGANNPVSDADDQDSHDGGGHQREGNKWQNERGDHHHASEKRTYHMRKVVPYPSYTDTTSPGGKRNLLSNSIPSSASLKKGSAAQEDESTADEHSPKNKGSKIYKLKSKRGSSSFMCHPDGRRRRVSPTRRSSISQSSVGTSERSFQGGRHAKEGRGRCQREASHRSDRSGRSDGSYKHGKRDKRDRRDKRDKHSRRRRSESEEPRFTSSTHLKKGELPRRRAGTRRDVSSDGSCRSSGESSDNGRHRKTAITERDNERSDGSSRGHSPVVKKDYHDHAGRKRHRRSYDDASPYEQKYPTQEAKRGERTPHDYMVGGRGRPHGAHLSDESVHREDESSSEYRREAASSKTERNKIRQRGRSASRRSASRRSASRRSASRRSASRRSASRRSAISRSASRRSRSAERHPYSRRKRHYRLPAEEDSPNIYRKKYQSGKERQDWHKDGGYYYRGEGEYEKDLPPKGNHRGEGPSRGGSAKLSDYREDPNLQRRTKEYPQSREWRERPLNPHRDEGNESATEGEEQKTNYHNYGREKGQRSGRNDLHQNHHSSRKRDRSEMDDEAATYEQADQGRHYYPPGEAYHARGRNPNKRLNTYKGDSDDEEKEAFKPRPDQRLPHRFERDWHANRRNEHPRRNGSCEKNGDVGSDLSVNELNFGRMKRKEVAEYVQVGGSVEIELLSDADFTNWASDHSGGEAGGEAANGGVEVEGDHRNGNHTRINFRNCHLRKFVLCGDQLRMGKLPPTKKRSVSVCSSDGNAYSHNKYAPPTRIANYKQSEYRQEKNPATSPVGNKYCDVPLEKRRGSHSDRSESPDSFGRSGYMSGKNSGTKNDSTIERRKQVPSVEGEANRRLSRSASPVRDALVERESGREGEFPGGARRGEDGSKFIGGHQVDHNERIRGSSRGSSRGRSRGSSRGSTFGAPHNAHGDGQTQEMIPPPRISDHGGVNQIEGEKDKAHSHGENHERRTPQHCADAHSGIKAKGEENHRADGKNDGDDTLITEKEEGNRAGAKVKVATTTPTWVNVPEWGTIPNYINEIIKNMNNSYEINEPIDVLNLKAGKSFRVPELLHLVKEMTSTKSFLDFLERRKEAQKKWKMVARNIMHEEFKLLSDSISRDVLDAKIKFLTSSLRSL
ncbi:unnamed protein product [Plasmodium vivax]|uniref:(malaria parasite P. vivax) hypothetical protein n=1 Tax=Plasmodium vivax TaxID=5855 RepID=A0A8S4HGU9_PLAVI|nr:unnamed protein product [Plasmodium vivax]